MFIQDTENGYCINGDPTELKVLVQNLPTYLMRQMEMITAAMAADDYEYIGVHIEHMNNPMEMGMLVTTSYCKPEESDRQVQWNVGRCTAAAEEMARIRHR